MEQGRLFDYDFEADFRELAEEIAAQQKVAADSGAWLIPRSTEFLYEMLKLGRVFLKFDERQNLQASCYFEYLSDNLIELGGLVSDHDRDVSWYYEIHKIVHGQEDKNIIIAAKNRAFCRVILRGGLVEVPFVEIGEIVQKKYAEADLVGSRWFLKKAIK